MGRSNIRAPLLNARDKRRKPWKANRRFHSLGLESVCGLPFPAALSSSPWPSGIGFAAIAGSMAADGPCFRRRASQRLAKAWPMQSANSNQIVSVMRWVSVWVFETKRAQLNAGLFD